MQATVLSVVNTNANSYATFFFIQMPVGYFFCAKYMAAHPSQLVMHPRQERHKGRKALRLGAILNE